MNKKFLFVVLIFIIVEVAFGFIYTRYSSNIIHPIISDLQFAIGFVCGLITMEKYRQYIKN